MREVRERSSSAVIRALVQLSWLRFRHTMGWPGRILPGMRQPTRGKNVKGAWFVLLFAGLFLTQGFWLSKKMVQTYAERSLGRIEGVLSVDHRLYHYLESNGVTLEQVLDEDLLETLEFSFFFDEGERKRMGFEPISAEKILQQFREKGVAGFRDYEASREGGAPLNQLRADEKIRFERLMGMMILASLSALLFMPLALRERDLAATNDHLEWLFSLPLKGSELLLGKFVSITLIRPLVYLLLWPILTNVLVANGGGFWVSGFSALGVAFLVSVALSGVEILIDTWLRSRAGARTVKNVQMVFSITGLLSFYAVLAACFASAPSFPWVNWLAERLPGSLGQPLGALALSPIATVVGVAAAAALVLGIGGFFGGDYLMRAGLLSGNVQQAKVRGILGNDLRKSGLLRFEWLLLMRDRALATQVVLVPVLLVVYQLLVNPTMIEGATVGGICAMAYGCGTYASLITAPQLLMSESKGVWLIYNLPVPIAAYFRRREMVWRSVATGLAGVFVVAMIFWSGSFKVGEIWRYLAALLGVWVMGRIVSGIVMGQPEMPDAASGDRPKMSFGRMYGAMILAGIYVAMLWQGQVWSLVSALVIFSFLGTAIWQRREVSFSYLMEPTEKEPPSWGVDDGLWSVFVFFVIQVVTAALLGAAGWVDGGSVLVSFVAGGMVALGFSERRKRKKGIPLPEPADEELVGRARIVRETFVATGLCLAVAWLWLAFLQRGDFLEGEGTDLGIFAENPWVFWVLAVVAAPLIEEPLFRGFVCRTMMGFWSKTQAIVGSALVFAIVHPGPSFPPVFLLGLATAVIYSRSRSIVPGIVLHALYNLGVLTMASMG